MMRSLFSGVSGLRAHQQKMDVIGNNVANVNTVGYKAGRVTFSDVFSQTLNGATSPDSSTGSGGRNPMQVGLGVGISAIDTITTRGSTETTGSQNDIAISGNGFFIVRDTSNSTYEFTRAGNFTLDKQGNLVTADGAGVYGWMQLDNDGAPLSDGSYVYNTDTQIEAINIYSDDYNKNKKVLAAKATTSASFTGSLDSTYEAMGSDLLNINSGATARTSDLVPLSATDTITPQFSSSMTVYDSLGNKYEVNVNFTKCSINSTKDASTNATTTETSWYWEIPSLSSTTTTNASGYIKFDSDGNLVTDSENFPIASNVTFTPSDTGSSPFTVKIDFSKLSMTNSDSSVKTSSVDGYAAGTLEDYSIGADGVIMGVYSNGKQKPLGMIALATFDNPAGLLKSGSNTYIATANSGDFKNGVKSQTEGTGALSPGCLEMSNVDLSNEFSEMIITQRGFQANSRIITTSDEMLEELVNLKR